MNKILSVEKSIEVAKRLRLKNKSIVLAGGCFDILHVGHVSFLEKAKAKGDILLVMLEHDNSIRRLKGKNRPIHTQKDRAKILASISLVDYVILLPDMTSNTQYDTLIKHIKPAIIATTKGDSGRFHKERQAYNVNAKVVDVTDLIKDQSTSRLVQLLKQSDI